MRPCVVVIVTAVLALCTPVPAPAQAPTAVDKFIGRWVEDESKRKVESISPLQFRSSGGDRIEEVTGPDTNPRVLPVVLDGKPYSIDVNRMATWKKVDEKTYEMTQTEGGEVVGSRTIRIAADAKTLTQEVTRPGRQGAKTRTTTTVFQRTEGDRGLIGKWKAQSFKSSVPSEIRFDRVGGRVRWVDPLGGSYDVALDGKPAPVTGPAVISGSMAATRMRDERTLEMIATRNRQGIGDELYTLSADGKTLTRTSRRPPATGFDPQTAIVYVKQ